MRCDYAVNAGDGAPEATELENWPLSFPGPVNLSEANYLTQTGGWPKPPRNWSGISWLRSAVQQSDILDGCSNVFLFGEKYVMRDAYYDGRDWGDNEPVYCGFDNDNHRSTNPYWPFIPDRIGEMSIGSFGSAHFAGANFVMADGSVHLVQYGIDESIFRRLGNRNDGNSVEVPQ